jgi:GH25 family lysozyme M1 (1,4-beta-N-acetylmuramidase)
MTAVVSAQGKDFSAYQRPVTPADLAGLSFAYTRVSNWSGTTMGTDVNFTRNWAAFETAGIHRAAYWFFNPSLSPVTQATYFATAVKRAGLLPTDVLCCDSETLTANVDAATLTFQRQVKSLTGLPVEFIETYANLNVAKHLVATSGEFPTFWVAWPSATAPVPAQWAPAKWKTWTHWQFGISRGVDADAYNGTAADLNAWVASHIPAPIPVNAVSTVTTDGKQSLAQIAAAHHTQPSGILRATAIADGLYAANVAAWLNTDLATAVPPAGLVLHIPAA